MPLPLPALSVVTVTPRSVALDETVPSAVDGPTPGVPSSIVPTPPLTAKPLLVPDVAQLPPLSAVPQPLLTVRLKLSEASTFAGGAVTVTDFVTLFVAPLSSVTVSFTAYV